MALRGRPPQKANQKKIGAKVSNRTMVANLTAVRLCWFRNGRPHCKEVMKIADRENLNGWANVSSSRALGADGQNTSCSHSMGCEAKRNPADGIVFLLDFSLYRTNQDLTEGVSTARARLSHWAQS